MDIEQLKLELETAQEHIALLRTSLGELVERRRLVGIVYGHDQETIDGGDGRYARARAVLETTKPKPSRPG